jgi:hypothetical protein
MIKVEGEEYDLLMSFDPCSIFEYYGVERMHGLSVHECKLCENSTEFAYIAGWCNLSPTDNKPFVFINLSRCTDTMHTTGLVMHEMSHLYWLLNYDNLQENEEDIITNAELETYKVVEIINKII